MLKRKINEIILYFSKFFLVLFVKLNSPLFSSIILLINLRKVKKFILVKMSRKSLFYLNLMGTKIFYQLIKKIKQTMLTLFIAYQEF